MDIYDNLDVLGVNYEKLKEENRLLTNHTEQLENDILKLCTEIKSMKLKQDDLTRNISELYKTAKCELERKDRTIADLRKQLDEVNGRRDFKQTQETPYHREDRHYNKKYERSRSPKNQHYRPQHQHQHRRTSKSPFHKNKRSNSPKDHHWRPNSSKDRYWGSKSRPRSPPHMQSRSPPHIHSSSPPHVHSRSPPPKRRHLYNNDAEFKQDVKEEKGAEINSQVKCNGQLNLDSRPIIPKVEFVVKDEHADVNFVSTVCGKSNTDAKQEVNTMGKSIVKKECVKNIGSVLTENAVVKDTNVSNKPVALRNRRKHCVMRLT